MKNRFLSGRMDREQYLQELIGLYHDCEK
jgi:hypothetical protein